MLIESVNLVEVMSKDTYVSIFGSPISSQIHLFLDSAVDNSHLVEEFHKAALFNKEEGIYHYCYQGLSQAN